MIFRLGVGHAPTLEADERGLLDCLNNGLGPTSWFLADLAMLEAWAGEEVLEQVLRGVSEGEAEPLTRERLHHQQVRFARVTRLGGAMTRGSLRPVLEELLRGSVWYFVPTW